MANPTSGNSQSSKRDLLELLSRLRGDIKQLVNPPSPPPPPRGRSQFIPWNQDQIRWAPLQRTIVYWIEFNLLGLPPAIFTASNPSIPKLSPSGDETNRTEAFMSPSGSAVCRLCPVCADAAGTRALFATHHIDLPAWTVTSEQGRLIINE